MNWILQNWDKLLSAVLGVVVGSLTGFFSAIIVVKSEISELHRELALIKAKVDDTVLPKLAQIDSHSEKLNSLEIRFAEVTVTAHSLQDSTNKLFTRVDSMLIFSWQKSPSPFQ